MNLVGLLMRLVAGARTSKRDFSIAAADEGPVDDEKVSMLVS
jgi:hypothetical protein